MRRFHFKVETLYLCDKLEKMNKTPEIIII